MKDNRSVIQKSISFLLVGLIFVFALSSFGNVREYIARFHAGWTSWALGGGFSVAVFVCAYLAATAKTAATRNWSIAVSVIFGIASGAFQFQLYTAGKADWLTAFLLSFIPIVVGEVGLALVESSYSREKVEQMPDLPDPELETLRQQLADVELRWTNSEQQLNQVQNELNNARLLADERRTQSDEVRQELDALRTEYKQLRKEFNQFNPASVLSRLNDTQRQKMSELLALVSGRRIEAPGDLIKHGLSKSDTYALWPVATAAQLVYVNGDGAYHVRG